MNVVAIYAEDYFNKLNYVFDIFSETCKELGVLIEKIDIISLNLCYFSGKKNDTLEHIFNKIKNASGIIFVCSAKLFSVSGGMQVFLEHFDINESILQNKRCYSIVISLDGSEFNAGVYLNNVINILGGNSIGSMLIGSSYLSDLSKITQMIERYAEDFYRLLKQNRELFKHFNLPNLNNKSISNNKKVVKSLNGKQVSQLYQKEIDNTNNVKNNYIQSYDSIKSFNTYQDEDITEITKFLKEQYNKNNLDIFNVDTTKKLSDGGNCKQRTKSLYHYFQPQIAQNMDVTIQLNISGEENFKGYFKIKNRECNYIEGESTSFDVAIISDSKIWDDVLNGKYTLQKAFMLGKVKVKGNFVIISKFEQIFKL